MLVDADAPVLVELTAARKAAVGRLALGDSRESQQRFKTVLGLVYGQRKKAEEEARRGAVF